MRKDTKIVVNSNTFHGYSLEETIPILANHDVKYIELTATEGWTEHVHPSMPLTKLIEYKEMLKKYDITPIAMSGHTNIMDPDRIQHFIDNIYLAHFFDCSFIVTSVGEAHLQDNSTSEDGPLIENIKRFIPYLDEFNMQLVIEVHGDHGSGERILEIIKEVNHPRVKINYDTANVLMYSDKEVLPDLKTCIDEVTYIHIKDKLGKRKDWNFPALGQGNVDFDSVFKLLDEYDNTQPLSIEIEFTSEGPKDIHEVEEALKESLDFLVTNGYTLEDN